MSAPVTVRRIGLAMVAPAIAIAASIAVSALILWIAGHDPWFALREVWSFGWERESVVSSINRALPLFFSGLAFTIAFRNNLFHIGVEGEYRVAALLAAAIGTELALPAPLHLVAIVFIAMAAGAAWAGGIALLKVRRGVHEVISSIMMNAIALALTAFLARDRMRFKANDFDQSIKTELLPASGQLPSLNSWLEAVGIDLKRGFHLSGFLLPTIVVGVVFWYVMRNTRFGFDLRAAGMNPRAAQYAGVDPTRMIYTTMLLSGAIAGLIGLPYLLGESFQFDLTDFPQGLGFTGIAVALLGRGHPAGIAAAALLFGWLDRVAQRLDLVEVPNSVILIMKGMIPLLVVVAYEVVRRTRRAQEAREVAAGVDPVSEAQAVGSGVAS